MTEINNLNSIVRFKEKLENDSEFKRYRELGVKVHQNKKLLALYEEYLNLQKEVVNLSHYQKLEAKKLKEQELQSLQDELYDNPLFNEYIQMQVELEELFQTIAHLIENHVNRYFNE